jgi:hypothetical protein
MIKCSQAVGKRKRALESYIELASASNKINPSTPRSEARGMLRVDTERRS